MRILVTGGTGYIGEHFVPELIKEGHSVRLLVRNLDKAKKMFGDLCEYFVGDVTDKDSLEGCCSDMDIVFHMVAKVGNQLPSKENFEAFRTVNVEGTHNLIEESKKTNVKKFVFVSSIAAMGIVKENPITEESICEPYLPYQITKYEAEQLVNNEFKNNGFPGICIRPTKVYGIGEHEYSYLTLARLCRKGIFLKVGKGHNYTSNIYITDFVQALVKLVNRGRLGQTYILSSSQSIDFVESGRLIAEVMGKKIAVLPIHAGLMTAAADIEEKIFLLMGKKPIVTKRNIQSIVSDRIYDISKAENDIGFEPQVTMEDGIRRVINWYKEKSLI